MAKQSTTLVEIREYFRQAAIQELDRSPAEANSIAVCMVDTLRKKYGGCEGLYIPKEENLEDRDWQMWQMFNGTNYDEVGLAFDLTARQVRNRIRIIKPIAIAREQRSLFEECMGE